MLNFRIKYILLILILVIGGYLYKNQKKINDTHILINFAHLLTSDYKRGLFNNSFDEDNYYFTAQDFKAILNSKNCASQKLFDQIERDKLICKIGFNLNKNQFAFIITEETTWLFSLRYHSLQNYKPEPNNEGDQQCKFKKIEELDDGWYYVIEECSGG